MGDLSDPRLTKWRDESKRKFGGGGVVWRRYWTVGACFRAAVVFETLRPRKPPYPKPYTWCTSRADGHATTEEGKADSVGEAMGQANKALAGFLREMPAAPEASE